VPVATGDGVMSCDEGIRADADADIMAELPAVFRPDGLITAGNASQISDGAAALLVAERSAAEALGLTIRAVIRSMTVAADDPVLQFTAVIPAARAALDRLGLRPDDIDIIEVNEAFAPVPLGFARAFGLPIDRVNVHGGSIAIGHPLGSTGARLLADLTHELERTGARRGLVVVCEGGGMANATIIERCP
jgi:acetyl-CoA acyltransferase